MTTDITLYGQNSRWEDQLREAIWTFNDVLGSRYEQQYGNMNAAMAVHEGFLMSRGRNFGRGEDPFVYQTVWHLWASQYHSRLLCRYNEFAIGAITNRTNYVAGEKGFSAEAVPINPEDNPSVELCKRVQEFVDLFEEVNNIHDMISESVVRWDEDGEFFVRLFFGRDGMTKTRFTEPEHVSPKFGDTTDPKYSFGIETDRNDVMTVLRYWVNEEPWKNTEVFPVPETEMVHGKNNSRSNAKRGYPSFIPVGPNFRRAEDLLASLTQIARTRAKIALIRQVTGADQPTAQKMLDDLMKTKRKTLDGTQYSVDQMPNGAVLTSSGNIKYEFPNMQIGAMDFVEVLQAELRAIAVRFCMPEWMFTAVADAKYSNAFVVEAPATKEFSKIQNRLHRLWVTGRVGQMRSVYWRAINHAIRMGVLPKEVIGRVKLVCNGPTLVSRDQKSEAEVNKLYMDTGVKDIATVQRELGVNPDDVAANKVQDFQQGRVKLDLATVQLIRTYINEIATGVLSKKLGYTLIGTVLGVPIEVAEQAFPVEIKPTSTSNDNASKPDTTGTSTNDTQTGTVGTT